MSNKKYPIGIQNFESLRNDGYFYVDKTASIYQMVKTGSYYFLNRPRRFGKSLLISTLKAYFQGKKELFEGLAVEKLEKDWVKYPILHIDLNAEKYDTPESLENKLNCILAAWEQLYGTRPSEVSLAMRFEGIIERAYRQEGQRVVILVDEYDKPMLQAIGNEKLQKSFCNTLRAFYGALKSKDGCIEFGMLTGVTKFGNISVFSDLNSLIDISMNSNFTSLCGITEEELHRDFADDIQTLAQKQNITYEEVSKELKTFYDGYHFTHNSVGIYNPFNLLHTFKRQEFDNYWFQTGTPTYLVELLQKYQYDLHRMEYVVTSADTLKSIDSASPHPIPVMYQSGYLTIKEYANEFKTYRLGFPNNEVERSFIKYLLSFYTKIDAVESSSEIRRFVDEVESGDYESFFRRLRSFFSDTPYELVRDLELHYQNVLFIVFKLVGFYVKAEYRTSEGRIDLVLQTDKFIYVMEFKLDGTAEEALKQINEKHYAQPFEADGRKLFKIGVNFSAETRNIEKWLVES